MAIFRVPRPWEIPERLATPEARFLESRLDRRSVLWGMGVGAAALALPNLACAGGVEAPTGEAARGLLDPAIGNLLSDKFRAKTNPSYGVGERPLTPENVAAAHNNFYEFTQEKNRVWQLARGFSANPWTVEIRGLVEKPITLGLEELITRFPLEERLYRHRCVERWAMQVPWVGFPLRRLLDLAVPLGTAKFVRFLSLKDPARFPAQAEKDSWLPWPYYEALRLDEARHELAFVVLGSYGHALPMQHGAAVRLAIPWKYGYKSPKSIVGIELVAERPPTFWNYLQPSEYGFYSNVDPTRPHPRWSQDLEQDIGTGERRKTLPFNGYGDLVAGMYDGREV